MLHTQTSRTRLLWLIALVAVAFAAGCAPQGGAVQTPPGTKVGKSLTQTQVQAIQQKRAGQQGN